MLIDIKELFSSTINVTYLNARGCDTNFFLKERGI